MTITLDASPYWPFIVVIAFLLACLYAWLVAWLNSHPRYGTFWSERAWVEVVVGNSLIVLTVGAIFGLVALGVLLAANVLWGTPMIVGTLISYMQKAAQKDDEQIANG